jgi:hypothetical protein
VLRFSGDMTTGYSKKMMTAKPKYWRYTLVGAAPRSDLGLVILWENDIATGPLSIPSRLDRSMSTPLRLEEMCPLDRNHEPQSLELTPTVLLAIRNYLTIIDLIYIPEATHCK